MSATLVTPKTLSGGEIITHLINATDGEGLHFDGAAGNINVAARPALGSQWSAELIIQADTWGSADTKLIDFGGNVILASKTATDSGKLAFYRGGWVSFGVDTLEDLKVHHLVIVVDETANTATLYDNGNEVASITPSGSYTADTSLTMRVGANSGATGEFFDGIIYRARLWNKMLSQPEVTASYENATVPFADQYGSQTSLVDAAASVFTSGTYSWVKYGTNTIANVSNTLAITYGDNQYGAYNYLKNASDLTADLTVGKKYRLTLDAKYTGGAAGTVLELGDGASSVYSSELTTSLVNYIFEFTAQSATAAYIQLKAMAASNVVTIDNWYVREIGCVSDYDLAFANPTQSLMVQDRAGAADGTSSATGVSQVTPIEQVNTKAISVSNATQRTPADGTLVADKVGVGVVPRSDWISDLSIIQIGEVGALTGGDTGWGGLIEVCANAYRDSGGFKRITADYATLYEQDNRFGRHTFKVAATGAADAAITWVNALTIDSAGNVGIGTSAPAGLLETATSAAQNLNYLSTFSTDPDHQTVLYFRKSSSATIGTPATTADNETLGAIAWRGVDSGGNWETCGMIKMFQDGTAAAKVPSRLVFYTGDDTTGQVEQMRISSAGLATFANGIAFSSQTDASGTGITSGATTLSHYESGTWTPRLEGSTSGLKTAGAANAGYYTRVGDVVTVRGTVGINGSESIVGFVLINGLPFTAAANRSAGTIGANNGAITYGVGYNNIKLVLDGGGAYAYIVQLATSGDGYSHTPVVSASDTNLYGIQLTYNAA